MVTTCSSFLLQEFKSCCEQEKKINGLNASQVKVSSDFNEFGVFQLFSLARLSKKKSLENPIFKATAVSKVPAPDLI